MDAENELGMQLLPQKRVADGNGPIDNALRGRVRMPKFNGNLRPRHARPAFPMCSFVLLLPQ